MTTKNNPNHQDGLGSNPLAESDPLAQTLYVSPTKVPIKGKAARKPPKEGQNWRLVTFSFYEEDVQLLDQLLTEAKDRGLRKVNRSQLMRFALRQIDLDKFPPTI
jgi:hypothetical protein